MSANLASDLWGYDHRIWVIAAIGQGRAIGKGNTLPWKHKADMQVFKHLTTGNTVIMGRKTFESLGKALPNRKNIVISRTMSETEGVQVVRSLRDALALCEEDRRIYVIGGAEIYAQAVPYAQMMALTLINTEVEGADALFPKINGEEWTVERRNKLPSEEGEPEAEFILLQRIKNHKTTRDLTNE